MKSKYFATVGLLPLVAATAGHAAQPADASTQLSEAAQNNAAETQPAPVPEATQPAPGPEATQSATKKKKWQFATIGYVWFAGAHGQTDVIKPVPPVDLDLPFRTAIKGLKFAFMGAAEARNDRIVVLGDLTYIHLGTKKGIGIRDPDFLTGKLTSKTAEVTLVGGYRVVDDPLAKLDLLAGGRLNWFNTSLKLTGPRREAEGSVKQTWLDPLIAARMIYPLGGKFSLSLYGDVGGFGIASDLTWQAVGAVNYQISRKMTLGLGWRHFKVNYSNGDFLYDVYQTGPLIVFRTAL